MALRDMIKHIVCIMHRLQHPAVLEENGFSLCQLHLMHCTVYSSYSETSKPEHAICTQEYAF